MSDKIGFEKLEIIYKGVNDLFNYEFNNKNHPEKQINAIINSINEFGFRVPILIDKNNIVVAGHGRLEAAKRLGLKEVPTTSAADLSPNQVKKYRLLDNKLAELSEDNKENINMELVDLNDPELNELYDFAVTVDGDLDDDFSLPDEDKGDLCQMTFTLHKDQKEEMEKAMATAAKLGDFDNLFNENKNGNAIARVCELFNSRDWQ